MFAVRRSLVFLSLLSLFCTLTTSCDRSWQISNPDPPNRPAPLPQADRLEAYFNRNPANSYRDPLRDFQRDGDNLEQLIVENIESAQTSLDVAIQELRLPRIAQAIADRHRAGVQVRVILENHYSRPWSDYTAAEVRQFDDRQQSRYNDGVAIIDANQDGVMSPEEIRQNDALVILRDAGVPVIDDTADGSRGSGLMHHKFVVIDNQTVVTGSANFTPSGIHGDLDEAESRGNANHLLRLESPELAAKFRQEFELMWGDGVGGQPDSRFGVQKPPRPIADVRVGDSLVSVKFSPTSPSRPWEQSTNGAIASALQRATNSVDLALFVFSEQQIADELARRHQQGVQVRALIDPGFAFRNYSEALDMLGVALADNRCRYEANNQPWTSPISSVGVPQLPPGDLLHHKFGLVDDRLVVTGSHNWSNVANSQNDETLLIVQNPTVASHFRREFDRLYAVADLGLPNRLAQRIQERERDCPQITVAGSEANQPVNLNSASLEELQTLPGVGEVLAQRIVEARPFSSLEDVKRVSGIGDKTVENWGDRAQF